MEERDSHLSSGSRDDVSVRVAVLLLELAIHVVTCCFVFTTIGFDAVEGPRDCASEEAARVSVMKMKRKSVRSILFVLLVCF
jgi:hypothetical protein